jgi:cytochrome c-type biogenesis protein
MESLTSFLSGLLALQDGNISFSRAIGSIFIAYLGGILSSLTPCVYPMIPITVSVVGGIGEKRLSWREVTIRGLAYVAGMAVVYSFLGVLAGITGKVFGTFTNTTVWYLGLGMIMTLAALIMLEIIPFDPAVTWQTLKRNFKHNRGRPPSPWIQEEMTHLGAFTLGASSGFIAAPCTTPVLTSILAFIAKTQSVGLGFFLMLSFSLGLGTLLMVIAVFAGAVEILPRSGKWMRTVKTASGLILLAFAEYLIYRAGTVGGL